MIIKFIFLAVFIYGCGNSVVSKKLEGSDSLVIHYYAQGTDSTIKTINTTQKTAIRRLVDFIASKETETSKCGFDGNLVFFKDNKVILPVIFQYRNKDCSQFTMEIDGKTISTRLSNEAFDFFTSLDQGKSYY